MVVVVMVVVVMVMVVVVVDALKKTHETQRTGFTLSVGFRGGGGEL